MPEEKEEKTEEKEEPRFPKIRFTIDPAINPSTAPNPTRANRAEARRRQAEAEAAAWEEKRNPPCLRCGTKKALFLGQLVHLGHGRYSCMTCWRDPVKRAEVVGMAKLAREQAA